MLPPNPPPLRLGRPALPAEDTRYPSRLATWWCWLTLRHRGHVGSGAEGVYWQCLRCTGRVS